MESTRHVWNGDVDLGDGKVQKQHDEYIERLRFVDSLISIMLHVTGQPLLPMQLQKLYHKLVDDGKFVDLGLL